MKVGVGITTRKRHDIIDAILEGWVSQSFGKDVEFYFYVVVDDQDPINQTEYEKALKIFPMVNYDFAVNRLGIAKAKNECLRKLREQKCDHLFLSDDDIFPIMGDWWKPFVNAGLAHQQYNDWWLHLAINKFHVKDIVKGKYVVYDDSAGVLQYVRGDVEENFNSEFGIYGFEHIEFNKRVAKIHKQEPFVSPVGVERFFYSLDLHLNYQGIHHAEFANKKFTSSVEGEDVKSYIAENNKVYKRTAIG